MNLQQDDNLVRTGVSGLDSVLDGGLTAHRLYLIEGVPGSGKTTMALQFLLDGVAHGETVLYVTLSETQVELNEVAASHGWNLAGVHVHELFPLGDQLDPETQYTMFHPSEVELAETTQRILQQVERLKPQRVVIDSLAEIRLLAGSPLRFRRQVLAFKQYFAGKGTTVVLLDESSQVADQGLHVHTIVHGVIELNQLRPEFGGDRRRLRVTKMRGRAFRTGNHDYIIATGGVQVFPRLVAAYFRRDGANEQIESGLPELDLLLGGGLQRGTSTLLIGAAGTGKSSLATHFVMNAAARGERSAMFLFDEGARTLVTRSHGMGFELEKRIQEGLIAVQPIDPGELSPGQFIQSIRDAVELHDARLIVIDSLSGYLNAMLEESYVLVQMHELLAYLSQLGVVTLLINSQQGLIGQMSSTLDVSYLADTVVLLRYFEADGEVRQAISVLKKRTGPHERTIREMSITDTGLRIGQPLRSFRGVLTGVPHALDATRGPQQ
ncbi:ATPase domain-containing protein [Agrilutibacter solisilvae]|uniref:non-specific serine/threonine protein kinase n=1 Tax=Agrilutibacter solisilvae TaxID=2763317 RepID=A0A974XY35_9GAMM|nr:ATPase domain-containing protein [Lysobacter solisilvae]QSX77075.1 AAA family ATPase [Lysobacter solisilvae]